MDGRHWICAAKWHNSTVCAWSIREGLADGVWIRDDRKYVRFRLRHNRARTHTHTHAIHVLFIAKCMRPIFPILHTGTRINMLCERARLCVCVCVICAVMFSRRAAHARGLCNVYVHASAHAVTGRRDITHTHTHTQHSSSLALVRAHW